MPCQGFEQGTGLKGSDSGQRVRALALELVQVAPLIHVWEGVCNRLGDCRDCCGVAEQAQLEHDVFVTLMSALAEKPDQQRQACFTFWQRIQCGT